MFTLFASLIGFLSSLTPSLLKIWQNKRNDSQELAIMRLQLEQSQASGSQKLQEIKIESAAASKIALYSHDSSLHGGAWIDGLRASVRPAITYAFFGLFAWIKITSDAPIWDENTQIIFAAIISFWFGDRAISR